LIFVSLFLFLILPLFYPCLLALDRFSPCRYVPFGPLFVQDAAAALLAADGVAPPQGELEAAVAADIVHGRALGVEGARQVGSRARGAAVATLVRGDLVGFARHGSCYFMLGFD